uniref:DUF7722 domain-containing protein n=1 Tax=Nelumbo nucifera TaxID=4432 RepID=A0A822XFH8_NELNU|nr:TPA_asm: hypothetical protein HUJ06_020603 [Nelumbo nucifera]
MNKADCPNASFTLLPGLRANGHPSSPYCRQRVLKVNGQGQQSNLTSDCRPLPAGEQLQGSEKKCGHYFKMPLHYPRYKKADYETMPEWQLDCLLTQYGLPLTGDVNYRRKFAMGAFLWPSQRDDP